jgi:hypothetical protein
MRLASAMVLAIGRGFVVVARAREGKARATTNNKRKLRKNRNGNKTTSKELTPTPWTNCQAASRGDCWCLEQRHDCGAVVSVGQINRILFKQAINIPIRPHKPKA